MTFGVAGLIAIADTDRTAMKSSTGAHDAPPLVVFQMPPPTLPANIVSGLVGLIASERIRPPMLPGPNHRHAFGDTFGFVSNASSADAVRLNIFAFTGDGGANSMRRDAPVPCKRSTCAFAREYGSLGSRPNRSRRCINR